MSHETAEEKRGPLHKFVQANRAMCQWIEDRLPESFTRSLLALHARIVARYMDERPRQVVIDAGGGRYSPYAKFRDPCLLSYLVAVDVLESEHRVNFGADGVVVANLCKGIPLRNEVADIVATRSVLEHLETTKDFISEVNRTLKPGGHVISIFPCKYSPFALINRILPHKIAKSLLHLFFPEWRDECGYRAYYNNCYYEGMISILQANGFEIIHEQTRYYQLIYYTFSLPFYFIMLVYDFVAAAFEWKNLSAQVLLVARKQC